jgi:hypothetical protein
LEQKVFQGCSILTWYVLPNQNRDPRRGNHTLRSWCACVWTYICGMGMYVVVDIWWNNGDKGVTWQGWKHKTISYFAPWGDTSLFWTLKNT